MDEAILGFYSDAGCKVQYTYINCDVADVLQPSSCKVSSSCRLQCILVFVFRLPVSVTSESVAPLQCILQGASGCAYSVFLEAGSICFRVLEGIMEFATCVPGAICEHNFVHEICMNT